MAVLPNALALDLTIGPDIAKAEIQDNFTAIQTAFNALQAILAAGASGQFFVGNGTTVGWAAPGVEALIYDNTVTGSVAASWDVPAISSAYKHLRFVIDARGDTAAVSTGLFLRFNADSGANYDYQWQSGTDTTAAAAKSNAGTSIYLGDIAAANSPANGSSGFEGQVQNYAATAFHKHMLVTSGHRYDTAAMLTLQAVGNWRSTVAISRITITPQAGNLAIGSRLTIYGVS